MIEESKTFTKKKCKEPTVYVFYIKRNLSADLEENTQTLFIKTSRGEIFNISSNKFPPAVSFRVNVSSKKILLFRGCTLTRGGGVFVKK